MIQLRKGKLLPARLKYAGVIRLTNHACQVKGCNLGLLLDPKLIRRLYTGTRQEWALWLLLELVSLRLAKSLYRVMRSNHCIDQLRSIANS